ncbi:MAG: indolepyruvate oxidoreductase subunit beta [Bacteroidales bacterium]|jgi:indolepyruvate ferredoxin oxidoreductase beta subunit|nr:indolepyruvate oxidoreductase subunit beta [Bacteroidales bacterium]
MKKDIVLAGVGGQGILSIAAIIGTAAMGADLYLKQAEVHGMSQRGGDVHSNLRLSDKPVASDLIPKGQADMIIAVEPMEALRYVSMLGKDGWLITNSTPYVNIPNYPDHNEILKEIRTLPKHIIIDADDIAKDLGNKRAANMVILGAALPFLEMDVQLFHDAVKKIFGRKGEDIVKLNSDALDAGFKFAIAETKK